MSSRQSAGTDTITEIPALGTEEWNYNLPRPEWLRVRLHTTSQFGHVSEIIRKGGLNTVCREARCPNCQECWTSGTATFIIMGDVCTRSCAYCAVKSGKPLPLNPQEPTEVAQAVAQLGLRHAVITSVDRDDCPDFGAQHFARTITEIRRLCPETSVEVLIPDFGGSAEALEILLQARPQILNHNVETVPRLYKRLRSKGVYQRCLKVLQQAAEYSRQLRAGQANSPSEEGNPKLSRMQTKSGLMLGFGESLEEIIQVMADLRSVGVELLTLGQYLRPSLKHVPVMRFWSPQEFALLKERALEMGFTYVESGPLVRSSYHAYQAVEAQS